MRTIIRLVYLNRCISKALYLKWSTVVLRYWSDKNYLWYIFDYMLEPVCCKKRQKSSWPVTGLGNRAQGFEWYQIGPKWAWVTPPSKYLSRVNFISFRTSRDPLFPKPVTCHELFFAISYSKPALVKTSLVKRME